jgi:hypothetical protein
MEDRCSGHVRVAVFVGVGGGGEIDQARRGRGLVDVNDEGDFVEGNGSGGQGCAPKSPHKGSQSPQFTERLEENGAKLTAFADPDPLEVVLEDDRVLPVVHLRVGQDALIFRLEVLADEFPQDVEPETACWRESDFDCGPGTQVDSPSVCSGR